MIALIITLIGIAQAQPIPPLLTDEIRYCASRICFRGVVVDKTLLGEIVNQLAGDPGMALQRNGNEVSASTRGGTAIFATLPDPLGAHLIIENVEIDFWTRSNGFPLLGEFILHYGYPCKIALNVPINGITLYYPNMYLNLANSDGSVLSRLTSLTPFLSVRSIIAYNDSTFCSVSNPAREEIWPGWGRLSRR